MEFTSGLFFLQRMVLMASIWCCPVSRDWFHYLSYLLFSVRAKGRRCVRRVSIQWWVTRVGESAHKAHNLVDFSIVVSFWNNYFWIQGPYQLFIYLFIHLFIHLFIYSFIHSFIHSFICLFIYLFICLFIYLFFIYKSRPNYSYKCLIIVPTKITSFNRMLIKVNRSEI